MKKKKNGLRVLLMAGIIVLVLVVFYFAFVHLMPGFFDVLKQGDEGAIEAYLHESAGVEGMICTALLQFLQVISIVLPGMPIQFAAGIVYGVWRGFLICHLSYIASNVCVFCVARHFKEGVTDLIAIDSKKSSKLDFIKNSSCPGYMTALACLIPVLPNGIVPYVSCQTALTVKGFAAAVWCGSFLPILAMCAVGSRVIAGEYIIAVLLFLIFLAAVILLTVFHKKVIGLLKGIQGKMSGKKEESANR